MGARSAATILKSVDHGPLIIGDATDPHVKAVTRRFDEFTIGLLMDTDGC